MFTKIFTLKARRLFIEGRTIYMCPNKLRPDSDFATAINVSMVEREESSTPRGELFDRILAACHYYNCNGETGYNVACYIKED